MSVGDAARAKSLSARARFPGISPRAYEHPADRGALVALRSVPGFDKVLKAISGAVGERSVRLLALASHVRVSPRQYPVIDQIRNETATTLDITPVPEMFVVRDPIPQAMAIGLDTPIITITTGLLDLCDDDGLRFVVGHEMGHVLSGHALYRTMLLWLIQLAQNFAWMPIGYWGLRAIILALQEWFRKSELSCDRAGLLCVQDAKAALRVHAMLAGATDPDEMDVSGFLEQATEYETGGDIRDSILKLLHLSGQTHPLAAMRAAELQKWAGSETYAQILAGDYPRRTDDAATPISDEVKAAARSYREAFTTSQDPLNKAVNDVGGLFVGAASRVRDWMGGSSGGSAGSSRGSGSPWGAASDREPPRDAGRPRDAAPPETATSETATSEADPASDTDSDSTTDDSRAADGPTTADASADGTSGGATDDSSGPSDPPTPNDDTPPTA